MKEWNDVWIIERVGLGYLGENGELVKIFQGEHGNPMCFPSSDDGLEYMKEHKLEDPPWHLGVAKRNSRTGDIRLTSSRF